MQLNSALPAQERAARLPLAPLTLGFAAMFIVMGGRTAFAVAYPAMVLDQGWTVAGVTGAFSLGLLVSAASAVLVGVSTDRFGCRATMLVGGVCLGIGMLLVALATEVWHLYVAYLLANGVGSTAVGFVTVVKALSMQVPRKFAAAFGVAQMGQGAGALVLSAVIQAVVERAGWRAAPLAVALLVALCLIPLAVVCAPGREAARRSQLLHRHASGPGLASWVFVVFFLANVGLGYQLLIPTHHVAFLQEAGFAPVSAALAAGAWGALTAVGGMVGGIGLERLGFVRLIALAVLLHALGMVTLIGSRPDLALLLLLFVVVGGFGRGMLGTGVAAAQTRAFEGPSLGRFTGLLELGFGCGAFLGPWLTALAHDSGSGYQPGLGSAIALALLTATMTILGSVIASRRAIRRS